jgi:hypothetical protein
VTIICGDLLTISSYYIINSNFNKINYNLSNQILKDAINQTSLPFDIDDKKKLNDDEFQEIEPENDEEKAAISQINLNIIEFGKLIDIDDLAFRCALKLDVSVIISPVDQKIEEDNLDFNINLLVEVVMANRHKK